MRSLDWAFLGLALLWSSEAGAETINVSPGDDYSKIEAALPGDIVEIEGGTYQFRLYLSESGTADNPIIIRAADPGDRPVWDLSGQNVNDWPGSYTGGDNDRGCWQVNGSGYEISGIVLRGCQNAGGNAAAIRTIDSTDVTLRDLLIEDNNVGVSGRGEGTLVEFSEFSGNGQQSSPPQHSTYIFGGSFHMRHCHVHDSVGGQNLHIRARDSIIEYNWIARSHNYEADIMTGPDPEHTMVFRGNVVVGNPTPENGSRIFVLFNDTGSPGVSMNLKLLWNTFYVQSGTDPALVQIGNDTLMSADVEISNNIVWGTSLAARVVAPGTANYTVSGTNNWFPTGADVGPLVGTIFGDDPEFTNAAALDFTLAAGSMALGAADTAVGGGPDREYFRNEAEAMMFRWRTSATDLGAFEQGTRGPGYGPYDDPDEPPPGGDESGGSESGDESADSGSASGPTSDTSTDSGPTGPTGPGGSGPSSDSSPGSGAASETDDAANTGASDDANGGGCGCMSAAGGSRAFVALMIPPLVRRRRRAL